MHPTKLINARQKMRQKVLKSSMKLVFRKICQEIQLNVKLASTQNLKSSQKTFFFIFQQNLSAKKLRPLKHSKKITLPSLERYRRYIHFLLARRHKMRQISLYNVGVHVKKIKTEIGFGQLKKTNETNFE